MPFLLRFLTLSCILLVGIQGTPAEAEAHPKTGRLTIAWGDDLNADGADHLRFFFAEDQKPEIVELKINPGLLLGGLDRWNGGRVTIFPHEQVSDFHRRDEPLRVDALSLLKSAKGAEGEGIFGSQPWVTLLCKFADKTAEPRSPEFIDEMFGNEPGQMDHYWREVSGGKIDLVGSSAAGWYGLPQNHTHYAPTPGMGENANLGALLTDCLNAADPFVDFSNGGSPFVGINLLFNDILDCCAYGGAVEFEIDGVSQSWRVTWGTAYVGGPNAAVLAHEIGHGFGLPHANNYDNDGDPYDSPWDVMSGANRYAVTHPDYTHLGKHTCAYHKERLGWFDAEQQFIADAMTDTVIDLDYAGLDGTNVRMARIPISDTQWYTIEARFRSGDYDSSLAGDAVIIHQIDTTRPEPAWAVDSDLPPSDIADNDGTMWTVGETFEDSVNGISISVEEQTATGFRVHIFVGVLPTIFADGFELGDTSKWSSATP